MTEPLDLAALAAKNEAQGSLDPWETRFLIAELEATRAERDHLLTVEAADAMLRDALARAERAEAELALAIEEDSSLWRDITMDDIRAALRGDQTNGGHNERERAS